MSKSLVLASMWSSTLKKKFFEKHFTHDLLAIYIPSCHFKTRAMFSLKKEIIFTAQSYFP